MRKIREVLRLHFEARLSERQISNICVLGKGTVRRFLKRAEAVELSWPLPPTLDDAALEKRLFPPPPPPSAAPTGLRHHSQGAQGRQCDPATALGGVQTGAFDRLQLQPFQRTIQPMVAATGSGPATGLSRRREDVRRSCRPDGGWHRPAHRSHA